MLGLQNAGTHLLAVAALALSSSLAGSAIAAPPKAENAVVAAPDLAKGTHLVTLGTGGGPIVREDRAQPANLLIVDGRKYLIDVGSGVELQLRRAGFAPYDVDRVFITHLHFDHVGGFASLLGSNWASGRQPIAVYGPPGTDRLVKGAAQYLGPSEDLFGAIFPPGLPLAQMADVHEMAGKGKFLVYQDDKIKVYAVENSHYSTIPKAKVEANNWRSYSLRFETPDKVVVFTGDTGPSAAVEGLAKGADILVSEIVDVPETVNYLRETFRATDEKLGPLVAHMEEEHLTSSAVADLANRAGVKMVVVSHLAPGLGKPVLDSVKYATQIANSYQGRVVIAQDLEVF